MKKLHLTILLCLLMSCSKDSTITETTELTQEPSKPNILLIIADDFGLDACPNYSVGAIKPNMPNLQNLINNGVTFDNFWATPLCSPTRASILTGKHGVNTGVLNASDQSNLDANETIIQAYLDQELGKVYSHSLIGKWHLSSGDKDRPNTMGIDYYAGVFGGSVSDYNNWSLVENGVTTSRSEYVTTKLTDLAINWINEQETPWFCWLAYTTPHTPFHLPPENMHSQGVLPSDQASIDANPFPYFMAMVESLDFEMGRIFSQIPQDELDNTLIVFIGDNGTSGGAIQNPYSSNRAKGSLYQGGINVPLIVSGKGVTRFGDRDSNLISSTDLFATIAQVAGTNSNEYENSISFKSLFSSSTFNGRSYNYSDISNVTPAKSGYTIRDLGYKLFVLENGAERFYNLIDDPFENNNLINNLTSEEELIYNNLKFQSNLIRE